MQILKPLRIWRIRRRLRAARRRMAKLEGEWKAMCDIETSTQHMYPMVRMRLTGSLHEVRHDIQEMERQVLLLESK